MDLTQIDTYVDQLFRATGDADHLTAAAELSAQLDGLLTPELARAALVYRTAQAIKGWLATRPTGNEGDCLALTIEQARQFLEIADCARGPGPAMAIWQIGVCLGWWQRMD